MGLALVFAAGPTAGDIGSCSNTATELDRDAFVKNRKSVDCTRCTECGFNTARCQRACNPDIAPEIAFPDTCYPLQHDGDVCIRALRATSCDDYAAYVSDLSSSVPTECDFCQVAPLPDAGGQQEEGDAEAGAGDGGLP
jgi:hypothetical protein